MSSVATDTSDAPSALPPAPSFAPPPFLPVQELLEFSRPEPRVAWVGWGAGLLLVIVITSALITSHFEQLRTPVRAVSVVAMFAIVGMLMSATLSTVRLHQQAQRLIDAAGEMVQLRRWAEAAVLLQQILSHPARTANQRTQA